MNKFKLNLVEHFNGELAVLSDQKLTRYVCKKTFPILINAETEKEAKEKVFDNLAYLIQNFDKVKLLVNMIPQLDALCGDNK